MNDNSMMMVIAIVSIMAIFGMVMIFNLGNITGDIIAFRCWEIGGHVSQSTLDNFEARGCSYEALYCLIPEGCGNFPAGTIMGATVCCPKNIPCPPGQVCPM